MTSYQVDCRGLACPQPVLETRKALERAGSGTVVVIVDNEAARENVRRFAEHAGWAVAVEAREGSYYLTLSRGEAAPEGEVAPERDASGAEARPVYLVSSNVFGQGSPDLGATLMKSLFTAVAAREPAPAAVIFLNTGVFLSTEGSPVLDALHRLAAAGSEILSCGTCLEYYGLKEKLAVGRVSNMYEINAFLAGPHKVIGVA
ncbi:MAG: sulfurtransferase-like selenium metabolism protein YedF [Bacillota bacterium]